MKLTEIGWFRVAFIATATFGVFLATNVAYPFRRPDYFLLADAFLHGRTWIDAALLPPAGGIDWDVINHAGHTYLPFGPGPALLLIPLVAFLGPVGANGLQPVINSAVAALDVCLLLLLVRRIQPTARWADSVWLIIFMGFSLPLWWITVRMGPWHFAQLIAVGATTVAILELVGRCRGWVIGLSLAFAILARLTLVIAVPFVVWYLVRAATRERGTFGISAVAAFSVSIFGALGATLAYNGVRFGSPLESGYALSALPPFLADLRAQGLFSFAHLPSNVELLLFHLPVAAPAPYFLRPDGLGLSIVFASPGLFVAARAEWSRQLVRWAAVTGFAVLIPSLLYYGGGWIQLGFRYLLDTLPFIGILVASAIRRPFAWWWKALIVLGVVVNLWGVAWSYTVYLQ